MCNNLLFLFAIYEKFINLWERSLILSTHYKTYTCTPLTESKFTLPQITWKNSYNLSSLMITRQTVSAYPFPSLLS